MILTPEELNAAAGKINVKEVDIPELGGSVYVREITAGELDKVQYMCRQVGEGKCPTFHASCCVIFLSDENGKRLYSDAQANIINNLNGKISDAILTAGMLFNSIVDIDVDGLEKN